MKTASNQTETGSAARIGAIEPIPGPERRKSPSERLFGIVFAVVFTVVGAFPLISGAPPRLWALALAALLLVCALAFPSALKPANRVWMKFARMMQAVVTLVVLALMFFGAVMPVAVCMRLLSKDPLNRRFDRTAKSYWIEREPAARPDSGMNLQY